MPRKQMHNHEIMAERAFQECAVQYIEDHRPIWKNAKHAAQWRSTLEAHAFPVFGDKPVGDVNKDDIVKVLKPIWQSKTETATRVRSRVEIVLEWANLNELRDGDNPARGKGCIHTLLGNPTKLKKVKHHSALDYMRGSDFMAWLRQKETVAALALEILRVMQSYQLDSFIFPDRKRDKGMSNMTMFNILKRGDAKELWGDITVHGFRSTFKDWAADCAECPNELSEMVLGHAIGNKVEAAYRRKTMLEKRRDMMRAWDIYCSMVRPK